MDTDPRHYAYFYQAVVNHLDVNIEIFNITCCICPFKRNHHKLEIMNIEHALLAHAFSVLYVSARHCPVSSILGNSVAVNVTKRYVMQQ